MNKICMADGCNRPVPLSRRFGAKYCSDKCRDREQMRRYRKKQVRQQGPNNI